MTESKEQQIQESQAASGQLDPLVMCKYSQGVAFDGTAILKDGIAMTIDEIVCELRELAIDARRYKYIRLNQAWHRYGTLADGDSYAIVGCKFPYLANFEATPMLDYNIDKMIEGQVET